MKTWWLRSKLFPLLVCAPLVALSFFAQSRGVTADQARAVVLGVIESAGLPVVLAVWVMMDVSLLLFARRWVKKSGGLNFRIFARTQR